ncbi:anti-sigma factor domain-containing protein [Actinoplanes sp. L3-i22]|uniref:anti-sigma factor n=1 Tax=Actinoplanes sp. L3-i22 TaxID=2836373 RepID=UPI001C846193|nr:anti-sigma factor [Actinoplanes sp. L3-i22]
MIADIHTLAGAYVLDAVDDLERVAFDRHLSECDSCRDEVSELHEATVRLAGAAWSVPPPRLRATVLTEIKKTRQLPPRAPAIAAPPAGRGRRLLAVAAAVLVAAAGAGSAAYRIQDQRVRDLQGIAAAARVEQERVNGILAAPDIVVRTQELAGGGRVTVAYSRLRDSGVVMMAADAAPTGGRAFQLWTVRSATPVDEGVLAVGQTSVVKVVDGLSSASDVGVTVEPAGGSRTPTLPMAADLKIL